GEFEAEPHVALALELARKEEDLPGRLAGEQVEPVLRRDLERQVRVGSGPRLHDAGPVFDDRVPGPSAVTAHVVLDHRIRPAGLVGPETAGHRLERFFHSWHSKPPFWIDVGAPSLGSGTRRSAIKT